MHNANRILKHPEKYEVIRDPRDEVVTDEPKFVKHPVYESVDGPAGPAYQGEWERKMHGSFEGCHVIEKSTGRIVSPIKGFPLNETLEILISDWEISRNHMEFHPQKELPTTKEVVLDE